MLRSTMSTDAADGSQGGSGGPGSILVDAFDFHYPRLVQVTYRAGAVADEPVRRLRQWGADRVWVVASRSLAEAQPLKALMRRLGEAGIRAWPFTGDLRHCPFDTAAELARRVGETDAQALVAVGGSSVSDTVKAANLIRAHELAERPLAPGDLACRVPADEPLPLRMIAAPTTLSGGEFTPVVGISDPLHGHKAVLRHPGLCFEAIVLDPLLLKLTPRGLLASTGFKLLDHAVERLLARNHLPLIDLQCVGGLELLLPRLERLTDADGAVADTLCAELLQVLWLIQSSHGNVGTGLSHALSHQLGSLYGLDHGWGSAIGLPAVLRLLYRTGRVPVARIELLAGAFGARPGVGALDTVLARLEQLRRRLGLPVSLREAGVLAIDVDRIVDRVLADPTVGATPGAPLLPQELAGLVASIAG